MTNDPEEFCPDCLAGMGSSEHREKCQTQRFDCDDYCMVPFGSHHPRCGARR